MKPNPRWPPEFCITQTGSSRHTSGRRGLHVSSLKGREGLIYLRLVPFCSPLRVWMDTHLASGAATCSAYYSPYTQTLSPTRRKKQEQQSLWMHPHQNDAIIGVLLQKRLISRLSGLESCAQSPSPSLELGGWQVLPQLMGY